MRKIIFTLLLSTTTLVASDVKEEISKKTQALEKAKAGSEKSRLAYELSLCHLRDQETAVAFEYFLRALDAVESKTPPPLTEKKLYEEAFEYYIAGGHEPLQTAQHLIATYGTKNGGEQLQFLLAIADANLGRYDSFFTQFYTLFPYFKEDFLAYKTQAILYLRLRSTESDAAKKELYEKKALVFLQKALEKNSKDASIYKFLCLLNADKKEILRKLGQNQVKIPRGEIYYYVKEAVDLGEFETAESLIATARAHYEYSRSIDEGALYLQQKRKA